MNDIDPPDNVKNPAHYKMFDGKYEVIHLIEDRLRALKYSKFKPTNPIIYSNYANVIKYTMRWFEKGGVEDLKKAKQYIDMMLGELNNVKD